MNLIDSKPESALTPKAQILLRALRDRPGQWLNRKALAAAVDKNRLNPNDINQLDKMADMGLIDMRKAPNVGVIPFQWVYRVNNSSS